MNFEKNQQFDPIQMMQQAGSPQGLAEILKNNPQVMNSEMGKNFVGMLEKGDMNGISGLGKNISETIGFTPNDLKQKIPAPVRKILGM